MKNLWSLYLRRSAESTKALCHLEPPWKKKILCKLLTAPEWLSHSLPCLIIHNVFLLFRSQLNPSPRASLELGSQSRFLSSTERAMIETKV